MNPRITVPTRMALLAAALAFPATVVQAVPLIKVHTLGDSLVLGSETQAREYVRDFYGYGQNTGDTSDPGDGAYNPVPFHGWRSSLQFNLADNGFEVDMLGTVSSVSDLPDTLIDTANGNVAATFTTSDSRTYTYDSDNNGHGGWRIGGTYSGVNAPVGGSFTYTAGQLPFSTFDGGAIDVVGSGTDVLDTGGNGLTADGANVFARGIADHLPEMADSVIAADAIFLQIGINDVKNREDVEGSGATITDQVSNGNGQGRLYDLIQDIRTMAGPGTQIYVSNLSTVNGSFDWNTTADAREAIDAFNDSFLSEYFSSGFVDSAGYTDAIAVGDASDDLDGVFLVNTHDFLDDTFGNDGSGNSLALSSDGLHWDLSAYNAAGDFYADLIAANTTVPEPTSALLLLAGACFGLARRRRSA